MHHVTHWINDNSIWLLLWFLSFVAGLMYENYKHRDLRRAAHELENSRYPVKPAAERLFAAIRKLEGR